MAEVTIDSRDLQQWLQNAERELPKSVSNRIKRTAVTEASKFLLQQLKSKYPQLDEGTIKRSMIRVLRSYRRRGRRGARGPDKYFLGVVGPNFISGPHAHLVEFGTGPRMTYDGQDRGEMPARSFFEDIFEASSQGGVSVVEKILERELGAEYQRLADGIRVRGGE